MHKLALAVGSLSLLIASTSTCFSSDGKGERLYGEPITIVQSTPLSEILADGSAFNKKEVLIEGTVSEVCANKGCWMFVNDGKRSIRVDFKNYGFFIPWGSEGKLVKVQGKIYKKRVDKNVLRHWAEDQKNPDVKPEEITEDLDVIMMTASGVLMEDGDEFSEEQLNVISSKTTKSDH